MRHELRWRPGGDAVEGALWLLRTPPHVTIKVKRLFPRADPYREGYVVLRDTAEVARDLEWLLERYPVEMTDEDRARLVARADEHRATERAVGEILDGRRVLGSDAFLAVSSQRERRDYQYLAADLALQTGRLLLVDELGLGKAQPLDASILTPTGFRTMGSLLVGDDVIGADGKPTAVIGIYPQGVVDCYRVTFSDGSSTECSGDHLWRVSRRKRARSKLDRCQLPHYWRTMSVREIVASGIRYTSGQAKWHVPMVVAPDFDGGASRPLDPYVIGALLGDGGFTGRTVRFTTADDELVQEIASRLPDAVLVKPTGGYGYRVALQRRHIARTCPNDERATVARGLCSRCYQAAAKSGTLPPKPTAPIHPVIGPLRDLGLWGHLSLDKFVPNPYKFAPAADRLALLQGLMDTDGYAMPLDGGNGSAFFYSSSRQLAEDVRWITESLGGTGRLSSKFYAGRKRFTVTVKLPMPLNPFRLQRKADIWGSGHRGLPPTRAIVSVDKVESKAMQCIRIASPDHLYVTDRFIVTHNTHSCLLVLRDPRARPTLVVCPTHLQLQWAAEIKATYPQLRSHIVRRMEPYEPRRHRSMRGIDPDVLIVPYSKVRGWAHHLAGKMPCVIFEEAHELRRADSQKYRACAHVAEHALIRVGATATPVYNYAGELHSIFEVLAPGVLGSREEFIREWSGHLVKTLGLGADHVAVGDPGALGTYLRAEGLMLRRTRKELARELPEVVRVTHPIDTDDIVLDRLVAETLDLATLIVHGPGDEPDPDNVVSLELVRRRRDLSSWHARGEFDWKMRRATGLAKAPYVAEFVKMLLESGEKVLLFGWHRDCYEVWLRKLRSWNPVMYTGTESPTQKQASRDRFVDGDAQVLMMSLRSGAGLDGLQAACKVVVFGELDWSPAMHDQGVGRLHRDGQDEPVVAYFLVSEGGTDPLMAEVLDLKRQQSDPVLDPDQPILRPQGEAADRIRRLAEQVLASRAHTRVSDP